MPGELNVNGGYKPEVKYCAICKQRIDCRAQPKVYTYNEEGQECHWHCLYDMSKRKK